MERFEKEQITQEKAKIKILSLEERLSSEIRVNNSTVKINGIIDRIDLFNGKIRVIDYKSGLVNPTVLDIKNIDKINEYFEVSALGNWENKNILVEKSKPPKAIIEKLLEIRKKRKKPFFDDKSQLDLNCLWISSLIAAHEILPKKKYLNLAEIFFSVIEEKYLKKNIQHSYSKEIVFIEDYAFLINALNDLSDKTLNFKYTDYAKKSN